METSILNEFLRLFKGVFTSNEDGTINIKAFVIGTILLLIVSNIKSITKWTLSVFGKLFGWLKTKLSEHKKKKKLALSNNYADEYLGIIDTERKKIEDQLLELKTQNNKLIEVIIHYKKLLIVKDIEKIVFRIFMESSDNIKNILNEKFNEILYNGLKEIKSTDKDCIQCAGCSLDIIREGESDRFYNLLYAIYNKNIIREFEKYISSPLLSNIKQSIQKYHDDSNEYVINDCDYYVHKLKDIIIYQIIDNYEEYCKFSIQPGDFKMKFKEAIIDNNTYNNELTKTIEKIINVIEIYKTKINNTENEVKSMFLIEEDTKYETTD